ncbi:MAG: hypothetical protein ACOX6U_00175 [Oscillospiraceae bacterium]
MRRLKLLCFLLLLPMIAGCASGGGTPYPQEEAASLMQETEQCIVDLLYGQQSEEEITAAFGAVYGNFAQSLWKTFADVGRFPAEGGYEPTQDGWFYPTIFHQGIVVADAYVTDTPSGEELTVVERYEGEDPLLQDFERITIFEQTADGGWVFNSFGGPVCAYKSGLTWDYLPLHGET